MAGAGSRASALLAHPLDRCWDCDFSRVLESIALTEALGGLFRLNASGCVTMTGRHGQNCTVGSLVVSQISIYYAALKFADLAIPYGDCGLCSPGSRSETPGGGPCSCGEGRSDLSELTWNFWSPLIGEESLGISKLGDVDGVSSCWAVSDIAAAECTAYISKLGEGEVLDSPLSDTRKVFTDFSLPLYDPSELMNPRTDEDMKLPTNLYVTNKVMVATGLYLWQFIDRHLAELRLVPSSTDVALDLLKLLRGRGGQPEPTGLCAELSRWSRAASQKVSDELRRDLAPLQYYALLRTPYWRTWSYTRAPQLKLLYVHDRETYRRCAAIRSRPHPGDVATLVLRHAAPPSSSGVVSDWPAPDSPRDSLWFNQVCGGLPTSKVGLMWGDP